tara:strand:- start:213 stop:356 length:144 start_codon:yes stop_codon:yes gene_type:complete
MKDMKNIKIPAGYTVTGYTSKKVACTCGTGENHFHYSGSGLIFTPIK